MGLPNLTGIFGDVANVASSVSLQDILAGVATTAAGTVLVSGAKSSDGQEALDPLHLFHKPATATAPAQTGVVQGGQVMKMSAFLALTPDQQKMISAIGYTIIPG